MTHDIRAKLYINASRWDDLVTLLKTDEGFIHPYVGGRCCGARDIEANGYSSITELCDRVFEKLTAENHERIRHVISELERLDVEAEGHLWQCPLHANIVTCSFDLFDKCRRGSSSLERLKNLHKQLQ